MIKVGIVGISGFSGCTLLEILLNHNKAQISYVSANYTTGKVSQIWPHLKGKTDLICHKYDAEKAAEKCDVLFLAVPHTTSMTITPFLLKMGKKVIDLSGDYRLSKAGEYKQWYGAVHKDKGNLSKAVYGLPELFRAKIQRAQLVANPGCYPTPAILSLAPVVSLFTHDIGPIFIDAKSGVSGAGKKAGPLLKEMRTHENFKAYKVLNHQHTPEINQYLSLFAEEDMDVTFVPHLLPVDRGILETIYVPFKTKIPNLKQMHILFRKFYKTEKFCRILEPGQQPELKHVIGTNFCDIGLAVDTKKKLLVVTAAIDNLIKGAAGQAVQNMNILFNLPEQEALIAK